MQGLHKDRFSIIVFFPTRITIMSSSYTYLKTAHTINMHIKRISILILIKQYALKYAKKYERVKPELFSIFIFLVCIIFKVNFKYAFSQ